MILDSKLNPMKHALGWKHDKPRQAKSKPLTLNVFYRGSTLRWLSALPAQCVLLTDMQIHPTRQFFGVTVVQPSLCPTLMA